MEPPFVVMAAAAPDAGNSGSGSGVDVGSCETAVTIIAASRDSDDDDDDYSGGGGGNDRGKHRQQSAMMTAVATRTAT